MQRTSLLVGLVCSAFSLAACSGNATDGANQGGTGGSGGATGGTGGGLSQSVCDAAAAFMPIDPTAMLDDLEDGNGAIARVGKRNGSWWVSTDGTAGTITPPADQPPIPEKILGGRCGSKLAIRLTGSGFTNWGAVMSVGMAYSSQPDPVDLSAFKGLMLWARVGEQNTSAIRAQFQDSQTQPEGGICTNDMVSSEQCYDGFGTTLTPIDTNWRLYKLDFSRMAQRDFGHHGDALDTTAIYDLEFNLEPNSTFDLWVDDLYFYD
ncbi:MAG: hypothetical protein QM756_01735 [Polyangiaceae bacterium]